MNLVEKSKLIQEIQQLISKLQQPSLTLFERAKSHQRLKDIFQSCDDAIFQKQLGAFKERLYPSQALQERLLNSHYQFSFCGLFEAHDDLQQQLKNATDTRWGLTHQKAYGWEIGLNSPDQENPIYYPAQSLEQCFHWLQQCQQDGLLKSDDQLQPVVPVLTTLQPSTQQRSQSTTRLTPASISPSAKVTDQDASSTATVTKSYPADPTHKKTIFEPISTELQLEELHCRVNPLKKKSAQQENLYQLVIQQQEHAAFLNLYSCNPRPEKIINRPVYLAEQIDKRGCFIRYIAVLGAENQMQAMRLLMQIAGMHQQELAAIKACEWAEFKSHCDHLESLYQVYSAQEKTLWQKAQYQAFVPVSLLHTHKFIAFEETPATYSTPLILLKERQKIRVVHGKSRLQLSADESVYPSLLLDRQDAVTWQVIQQTLQQLTPPIEAQQLYQAILQNLKASDTTKIA